MLVVDRDGTIVGRDGESQLQHPQRGYAELIAYSEPNLAEPDLSSAIGRLVELAFDELGLQILELRIRDARQTRWEESKQAA